MQDSKIIKIFLASSEELENDRNAFGNLIRRLDNRYEKQGIRIKLFEWEDYDAAYNNKRKQDEYNEEVRTSEMFLALFYKKAGDFTIEEFDVAIKEFDRSGIKPKNYVYCRDLLQGESEDKKLIEFKRRLSEDLKYYWMRYNNHDSLHLHFVMQLQLVLVNRLDNLVVENGEIKLYDMTIAHMGSLRFAADNPDFRRMNQRLQELYHLINEYRLKAEGSPNMETALQKLLDEKNRLLEEIHQQQDFLLDTAKRIATLQGNEITERMKLAIEAFERGDVQKANDILSNAENDANRHFSEYLKSKDVTDQLKLNVINSIDELLLKTSTLMADASIVIEERIGKTIAAFKQSDKMAKEVGYEKSKYIKLLSDYSLFLYKYGRYYDAKNISQRQMSLAEEFYGNEHEETANAYNNIAEIYRVLNNYPKAIEYLFKALAIDEKALGNAHENTAAIYNNIGGVYLDQKNHSKAFEYFYKALERIMAILGSDNQYAATTYNNIGTVFEAQGNYAKALEYLNKALEVRKKIFGINHPDTTSTYNNIGAVYWKQGDNTKALEYFYKALAIDEKELGMDHAITAMDYNNIGLVYKSKDDYSNALECYNKALSIRQKVLGMYHTDTALTYNNIGVIYYEMGRYEISLEFLQKALDILIKNLGTTHSYTVIVYQWIAKVEDALRGKHQ